MAMKILSLSQAKRDAAILSIVYGDPGVGKTTAIQTLPDPILIDLERGFTTLTKDIPVAVCDNLSDVRMAIAEAIKMGKKSIGIDSLPRLLDIMMGSIMKENNLKRPRIQDYGTVATAIKDLLWGLKTKNGINVIVTAYPTEEKVDDEGDVYIRPDISPKSLRNALPGICDLLGYLTIDKNGKRVLNIKANQKFYAKSRITGDKATVEPNFGKIIDDYYKSFSAPTTKPEEKSAPAIDLSDDGEEKIDDNSGGKASEIKNKTDKSKKKTQNQDVDSATTETSDTTHDGGKVAENAGGQMVASTPEVVEDIPATADQLKSIQQIVTKSFGASQEKRDEYRSILKTNFNVESAKKLSSSDAEKLIKLLEANSNV